MSENPEAFERKPNWVLPKAALSEEGRSLGSIVRVDNIAVLLGADEISLPFSFPINPQGRYQVLNEGWHSWSSSMETAYSPKGSVSMRPYEESMGGNTAPFIEPTVSKDNLPSNEGRSYGWVCFRDTQTGENIGLGIIPQFDAVEEIRYSERGGQIVVEVAKDFRGINKGRETSFKVFVARNNPRDKKSSDTTYADLVGAYSHELAKLVGIPLMSDRVIGFSWASHGLGINQEKIRNEVSAARGLIDTYVIDDGWEEVSGSLRINRKKFPDFEALIQFIKSLGIKPGLWITPFTIKEQAVRNFPKEWLMYDDKGRPLRLPLPIPQSTRSLKPFQHPFLFDISNPQFREYLLGKFVEFVKMGIEVFKVDFLAVPFMGKLQDRDKTDVEHYRQLFQNIRQRVSNEVGKSIEFIGCGAPLMESIGLFEGMRITPDSALPNLEGTPLYGKLISLLRSIERTGLDRMITQMNTDLYRAAISTAAKRVLSWEGVHGMIFDGIHLNDPSVPMNKGQLERSAKVVVALKKLGINNLFVGDSLYRVGEEGRKIWREYIKQFKGG